MKACDMPMVTRSAIDLLFADMDKLGPGDDEQTLYVLRSVPRHRFDFVVDAGCGAVPGSLSHQVGRSMRRDAQLLAGQVLVIGLAWDVSFSENPFPQTGSEHLFPIRLPR